MHGASCSTHGIWHVSSLASCAVWEFNVLAVRIVFTLFMSDGSWRLLIGLGRLISYFDFILNRLLWKLYGYTWDDTSYIEKLAGCAKST